jgi:hypothetical protein
VAIVLLMLLPGAVALHWTVPGPDSPLSQASTTYSATASLGAAVGSHGVVPFYGLVFTDSGFGPSSAAALGRFFNSTPFGWFRLSDGGAGYDPTTETNWVAPPSGVGNYMPEYGSQINLTWFKAWCDSLTPHCNWIAELPSEQNNTTAAVHLAEYFHNVLHFSPTAWDLGNEPNAWTHYGINASRWTTTDASTPTGIGYATMAHNYISAIRKLFPSDQFIGIESNCACGASLVSTTAQVDGSLVRAMAYHSYPWANDSSNLTSQFMGALYSPTRNLTYTATHMRELDTASCATCANIPIMVGEYNAGPVPVHSPLAMDYSGAPFLAASVIEALEANVSLFTLFSLGWLYNSTTATIQPEGLLYQEILDNMTMGKDTIVNVDAPGVGGVFAMRITNGTRESLLVVNTNNTRAISLPILTALFDVGLTGSSYSWDPRNPTPIVQHGIILPTSYVVWSQGILLLNNY